MCKICLQNLWDMHLHVLTYISRACHDISVTFLLNDWSCLERSETCQVKALALNLRSTFYKLKFSTGIIKETKNKLSPARIGSEKLSFYLVLICLSLAQRSSSFIQYLVCLRQGFHILTLIWIWSMVFVTPMIQILALYLDFEGAKNIHVL